MHHPTDRMFYLIMHSLYFWLFMLYGVGHMVKNHSNSEKGNQLLLPHGLIFSITCKVGFFICAIPHAVVPLSYFLLQQVHHDWCNKGCGMCYPLYGMVHIKEPLSLIKKNNPCSGGSSFSLSLSEWSFTICPMPYNHKMC